MTVDLAILGAMIPEIVMLEQQLACRADPTIAGFTFASGELAGASVVIARIGVGKVNAAMTTTLVLEHFQPRAAICTGVAGGLHPDLLPGDVVIAERTTQHDYGRWYSHGFRPIPLLNQATRERHPPFFAADPALLELAREAAGRVALAPYPPGRPSRAVGGTIATGDLFAVSRAKKAEIRARFDADACEMESAAVAQVCGQWGTPFLTVRGISDVEEDLDALPEEAAAVAAHNAARIVLEIARALGSGRRPI